MRKLGSTATTVIVAGVLVLVAVTFPLTTSLGQGVAEMDVAGWQGSYIAPDHTYHFQLDYKNAPTSDSHIAPLPTVDFAIHTGSTWFTAKNDVTILTAMKTAHPHRLETELGTRNNVPSLLSPFSDNPVAYTVTFLRALATLHVNPDEFGGPDIPPGSVPYAKLRGGLLQIDTLSDGNTFHQCQPGQIPPVLLRLNRALAQSSHA